MGCCDSESYARPPSQSSEVLGRLHMAVTGIRQHHFFDSKRSSFGPSDLDSCTVDHEVSQMVGEERT